MRILVYGLSAGILGGVDTFLLNMNKYMSDDFIFDYVIEDNGSHTTIHEKTVGEKGGNIYFISPKRKMIQNIRDWKSLLNNLGNSIDAVYFNVYSMSWLAPISLCIRKGYRVFVHAHNNNLHQCNFVIKAMHYINRMLLNKKKMTLLTTSELSSKFMFGKKEYGEMVYNAVSVERFMFDMPSRDKIREELNVSDKHIYGFVGRLSYQKNPLFLIRIFEEIARIDEKAAFLIIGTGNMYDEVKLSVSEKGLDDKIMFLGNRKNIEDYYKAMDVFILPSRFEGLGIVLIEAQASGLPCLASAGVIPPEAKVTDLLHYIPLDENPEEWAKFAVEYGNSSFDRVAYGEEIKNSKFNIVNEAVRLENILKGNIKEQ